MTQSHLPYPNSFALTLGPKSRTAMHLLCAVWVGVFLLFTSRTSVNAQMRTENGGVNSPETPTWQQYFRIQISEQLEEIHLHQQLTLGLTPKLELSLNLTNKIHHRASFLDANGEHESEVMRGPGDPKIRLKLNLFQKDGVLSSTRFALLSHLQIPAGNDDRRDGGRRIPRALQLGTGDWQFGGGAAFTVIRNRHRFSTHLVYNHRTRHEGIRLGSSIDWNLAYWMRISPVIFDPENPKAEIRGVIELLNRYQFSGMDATSRTGERGLLLSLAPGIQIYPKPDLLLEASLELPIFGNLDDPQGDRRWGALFSVKFFF
ncbi:MAG: hypothetical protein QF752_17455 [Planctomycetota bacterium]|nr:hypothetical protein [Planctomycetota bacterium]